MKDYSISEKKLPLQSSVFFAFGIFALILFGIKLWLIGTYGNATPFWDQWDAEAVNLYRPFLEGTLGWKELLATHNEHRIFTTRVFDIAILALNGIWNPLLQMVVNAVLDIVTLIFCIALLTRVAGANYLHHLLVFSLFLFGVPFAWENALEGFQTQFYFVLLFSIACIWFIVNDAPLSRRWWIGVSCAMLAFLSLASGVFAVAASAVVGVIFYVSGVQRTRRQLLAIAILSGLFVVGVMLTPTIARHSSIRASSILQFLDVFTAVLGWPVPTLYISALILNAPNLTFAGLMLWQRPPTQDRKWFLLALVIWAVGQAASIAYGRAIGHTSSRYLDLFSVGILINFTSLIVIIQNDLGKFNARKIDTAIVWVFIVVASLGVYAYQWIPGELREKHEMSLIEEGNTKNFLVTGDFSYLNDKPRMDIPYSNPERFASIITSPTIHEILPFNIRPPIAGSIVSDPADAFVSGGVPPVMVTNADKVFGSYGSQGKATAGRALLQFSVLQPTHLAIPISGYPLASGNEIFILQNNRRYPVTLSRNPENSWQMAYVDVEKGAFSIALSKTDMSPWFAVKAPVEIGRFDAFIQRLLTMGIWFVLIGAVVAVICLFFNLNRRKT